MTVIDTNKKIACFHCGEDCPDLGINIEEKYFCCNGCKMVYELLSENGLVDYYSQENLPGIKIRNNASNKFSYLENDEIKSKIVDFSDGKTGRLTLHLPQIHCSACIWLLENLHQLNSGVTKTRVNFLKKEATIIYNETIISLRQLIELLTSIGYEPRIALDNIQPKGKDNSKKILYLRLGTAGFAFGNIMLFSLPKYLDSQGMISENLELFFGYLNILLAIPVFLFSAYPYFSSAYHGLKQKQINMDVPISLGIIILFFRSLYEILSHTGIGYMDSFTGLVFFLLIGKIFQQKTYDALSFDRDYTSYFPISILKIENDHESPIPLHRLEPGDIIAVRNQELIPADATLLSDTASIDYSFVTGESEPVEVKQGETVFAGGKQSGPLIKLEVAKKVSQSYITQLWNDIGFSKPKQVSLTSYANRFSKYFTFGVISIALTTLVYWLIVDPAQAFNATTAVLIVACPCALALSTPFTLGTAQRILGRHQLFIKNSDIIERMAKVNHIVFDKTGTLTKSKGTAVSFEPDNAQPLTDEQKSLIKSLVRHSTHPLSRKIYNYLDDVKVYEVNRFNETTGKGLGGQINNHTVMLGSEKWVTGNKTKISKNDFSVMVFVQINGQTIGHFKITTEYRAGLNQVINKLKSNCTFSVLSGDNETEKARLQNIFTNDTKFNFNQSPKDKLNYIESLKNNKDDVLMLGDGLNDAGALLTADVGIAVSEDTASFTPASDAILDAAQFDKLNKFLAFSKQAVNIILLSFMISILYNTGGLWFAVQAKLSPLVAAILMPLSSISVVIFATLTTRLTGKRLGL